MQVSSQSSVSSTGARPDWIQYADRTVRTGLRHWLLIFNLAWGIFVFLPWLAPVLMLRGYQQPARVLYTVYSFTCHQLPERSYFLGGSLVSLTQQEIASYWPDSDTQAGRRQFIGNAQVGYKVAYSDRMVSLYTGMWVAGVLFGLVRGRVKPLTLKQTFWMALPMALDGTSHMLFDLFGIGGRDTNAWLQAILGTTLPTSFYVGDAFGSFNSLARLVTGALFGVALIGLAFPYLDDAIRGDLSRSRNFG